MLFKKPYHVVFVCACADGKRRVTQSLARGFPTKLKFPFEFFRFWKFFRGAFLLTSLFVYISISLNTGEINVLFIESNSICPF